MRSRPAKSQRFSGNKLPLVVPAKAPKTIPSPAYQAHCEPVRGMCRRPVIMSSPLRHLWTDKTSWRGPCAAHGRFWRSASPDVLSRGDGLHGLRITGGVAGRWLEAGIASPVLSVPTPDRLR